MSTLKQVSVVFDMGRKLQDKVNVSFELIAEFNMMQCIRFMQKALNCSTRSLPVRMKKKTIRTEYIHEIYCNGFGPNLILPCLMHTYNKWPFFHVSKVCW